MRANLFELINALPPELGGGIVLAIAVLMIGGMGVGLVEFARRTGLLHPGAAHYFTLAMLGTAGVCAIVLAVSVVALYLRDVF